MATNNLAQYGFRWQYSLASEDPIAFRVRVASGYQASPGGVNVDLNVGDPVIMVSDGTVALAAATNPVYGIVDGIGPYYNAGIGAMVPGGPALPGGTTYGSNLARQSFIYILPVANQVFEVDADDNVTATTEAAYNALIGENCDITINQVSGDTHAYPLLDISTHVTTSAQCRIIDIGRQGNTDFAGTRVKLLVTFNKVQQAPYVTTGV